MFLELLAAPLFTQDTVVFGLLALALGLVFYTSHSENEAFKAFYKYVPALFMAYLVPAIFTTLGWIAPEWKTLGEAGEVISHKSNLYCQLPEKRN